MTTRAVVLGPGSCAAPAVREWRPPYPLDLAATLGSLQRGSGDPTQRLFPGGAWRTALTPEGPATVELVVRRGSVTASAWGSGAGWLLDAVPDLLGARDRPEEFAPGEGVVKELFRRQPGLRLPRTGLVVEMLVAAVLEQMVTSGEARRSWRELLWRHGTLAPGPAPSGMRVVPSAATLARLPSWEWHRAGIDGRRRTTLITVANLGSSLARTADLTLNDARRALGTVPGVGPWTVAEVAARALGDADAVPVGDYHLPSAVGLALAGQPLDDAGMLRVLAPYRPQRYRVIRLLARAGLAHRPRLAPRRPVRDNRSQ